MHIVMEYNFPRVSKALIIGVVTFAINCAKTLQIDCLAGLKNFSVRSSKLSWK